MKVKFGTQLEDETLQRLKLVAAEERRPLGDVLQSALDDYLQSRERLKAVQGGLRQLLESPPLRVTDEQFRETMDANISKQ